MKNIKIIFGLVLLILLNGCIQHSALMGPAITIGTTGNIYQAGFSYASTEVIKSKTGSYPSKLFANFLKDAQAKKQMTEEQFDIFLKNIEIRKKRAQELIMLVDNHVRESRFIMLVDNHVRDSHKKFFSKK